MVELGSWGVLDMWKIHKQTKETAWLVDCYHTYSDYLLVALDHDKMTGTVGIMRHGTSQKWMDILDKDWHYHMRSWTNTPNFYIYKTTSSRCKTSLLRLFQLQFRRATRSMWNANLLHQSTFYFPSANATKFGSSHEFVARNNSTASLAIVVSALSAVVKKL